MSKPTTSMPKKPASTDLAIMARITDLYALLSPERREEAHTFIGGLLRKLPVIAEVQEPEPVPMFPDSETRSRARSDAA